MTVADLTHLRVGDVARELGVPVRRVEAWVERGRLQPAKRGYGRGWPHLFSATQIRLAEFLRDLRAPDAYAHNRLDAEPVEAHPEFGLPADEERALIEKAQSGDPDAKERLLTAFSPLIRSTVKKHMRGRSVPKGTDIAHVRRDIEHEVRVCVNEAIRAFDPDKGARLGTLAKTIIARRLPRQVFQRPGKGDALSRINGEEWDESSVSATQPQLTPVQHAKRIEIANTLRLTRATALTPDQDYVIRVRYDYDYTGIEAALSLGVSRQTIHTKERAALAALRGTLEGTGYTREDARADLAALSRTHARRTCTPAPDLGKEGPK